MKTHKTTLEDICAVIGFTATLRLSAWFGDATSNLYVPQKVEEGMLLCRLIGEPAARRMVEEWPGEHVAVPMLRDYEDDMRKRFVGRMLEQGFGTREISGKMRMSERRVQQICRELELAGLIRIVGGPAKNVGGKAAQKMPGKNAGEKAGQKLQAVMSGKKAGVD